MRQILLHFRNSSLYQDNQHYPSIDKSGLVRGEKMMRGKYLWKQERLSIHQNRCLLNMDPWKKNMRNCYITHKQNNSDNCYKIKRLNTPQKLRIGIAHGDFSKLVHVLRKR